ncbi:MAG: hypothetical protein Q7K43_04195 [Candidatus Woesearchaeota archaeon]|nr:hypothetical protein [Candidatus Woesearchaeota archaeon]
MVRLDVNKILARARRAEKKFEKFDKEFKQEQKEFVMPVSKPVGFVKKLPEKLLSYQKPVFSQKISRASSGIMAWIFQRARSVFSLLKNLVLASGKILGLLFGKIGSGFKWIFSLFTWLFKTLAELFRNKKILSDSKPKLVDSFKPAKQTWALATSGISSFSNKKSILGIIAIVLVVILVPFLVFRASLTNCGGDVACFGSLADQCKPAQYEGTIAGATVSVVARDCRLTKTIIALPETEPDAVKSIIVGKSMTCVYPYLGFDKVYVTKITGNLQTCSGELVDAIRQLTLG